MAVLPVRGTADTRGWRRWNRSARPRARTIVTTGDHALAGYDLADRSAPAFGRRPGTGGLGQAAALIAAIAFGFPARAALTRARRSPLAGSHELPELRIPH
jgi:hypothetical protein